MKILLDECVPWPIHKVLTGHTCATVQSQGWSGFKNGELLDLAEAEFLQVLRLDPHNADARKNLAEMYIGVPSQ